MIAGGALRLRVPPLLSLSIQYTQSVALSFSGVMDVSTKLALSMVALEGKVLMR